MKNFFLTTLVASVALSLGQQITLLENQPIYIEYQTQNKSSTSQFVTVKEVQTKRKASVELVPSEQDKAILKGYFRIQMNMDKFPSQLLEFETKAGAKLFAFVLPNTNSSEKALSVVLFQTEKEWQAFSVQFLNKASDDLQKKLQEVKASTKGLNKEQVQVKKDTIVRLNDRIQEQARLSFETQEALKRDELLKQQQAQDEAAKKIAKEKAKEQAALGDAAYKAEKFPLAVTHYQKAYELDPDNDRFLYQYGVTLYKVGNYNKSLSILSLAEDGDQDPLEHRYYVSLNHMKLKELDKALEGFSDLQDEKDPSISPTAAFFAGTIEFQKSAYAKSKERFQYVMDNTRDPKLDKQAEAKIEEIDRIESFLESQREILRYNLYAGLQYDGNVLNISTQNLATNSAAYRLLYGGSLTYYYFRTMTSKYAAELTVADMYSVDSNFKSDSTIQSADPLQYGLRLPINYLHAISKKAFSSNITPYYLMLNMSDDGGARKQILSSPGILLDTQWEHSLGVFHILKLDYVMDKSSLVVSSPDDDQSAKRMSFNYNWMKMLNVNGNKSILADLGYVSNKSDGKNNNYTKYILAATYSFPWSSKYNGSARMDYTDLKYPDNDNLRKDTILGVTIGATKDLKKNRNMGLSLSYIMNNSNVDSYKYNKFLLGFTYSFSGNYLRK